MSGKQRRFSQDLKAKRRWRRFGASGRFRRSPGSTRSIRIRRVPGSLRQSRVSIPSGVVSSHVVGSFEGFVSR